MPNFSFYFGQIRVIRGLEILNQMSRRRKIFIAVGVALGATAVEGLLLV
jgi:hypothetical protein